MKKNPYSTTVPTYLLTALVILGLMFLGCSTTGKPASPKDALYEEDFEEDPEEKTEQPEEDEALFNEDFENDGPDEADASDDEEGGEG